MEAPLPIETYTNRSYAALKTLLLENREELRLLGVKGSYFAYLLGRVWLDVSRCFLVVTADNDSADQLARELQFYLGSGRGIQQVVRVFSGWETLPYDTTDPHFEKVVARLETLHYLRMSRQHPVVIAPLRALSQRCIPADALENAVMPLYVEQEIDRDVLIRRLVSIGYRTVPLVEEPGELSVRGGIVDVFPPSEQHPVRIEFYGDRVDSIRLFNPSTQRSLSVLESVRILPVSEIILNEQTKKQALRTIEELRDDERVPAQLIWEAKEKIASGAFFPGISFLIDAFYERAGTLFDYLPAKTVTWFCGLPDVNERVESFFDNALKQRGSGLEDGKVSTLGAHLYLTPEEISNRFDSYQRVMVSSLERHESEKRVLTFSVAENRDVYRGIVEQRSETRPLAQFIAKIHDWLADYYTVVLVAHSDVQNRRLKELLEGYGLAPDLCETLSAEPFFATAQGRLFLIQGEIREGFRSAPDRLIVLTEAEVFGEKVSQRKRLTVTAGEDVSTLQDLNTDDFVVHVDYGIGRYKGLYSLDVGGSRNDFLLIEYRNDDRLYVPVHRLNLVQKYRGAEDELPALNKLGGKAWETTKQKIKESIKAHAKELLRIYAARQALTGFSFSPRDEYYCEFEARFEFEETPDQLRAIEDVVSDMECSRPMDRLVCGDTGYGKTEVALRAAFKSVTDGKQVAILVPTTVLAHQHYQTFTRRFRDFPAVIEMLSRFQTAREQKRIVQEVQEGKVDILIGTHRLLQKDVGFKDLGLVIIDEEHRFGVRHKETLKRLRELVDVMTLTATPIPRTLELSLLGIRDLSIIKSPPENRLSVKTFITRYDEKLIREAVIRELMREGQVFFVHNRVERIEAIAAAVQKIVPEARLAIAHGQMRERELEAVMWAFYQREVNLLLCTSIIESGLDFPAANTIIINRADTMGLAQLYQLRGRVGRSSHQAYAYYLIPGEQYLTAKARKRLQALSEFSELGSGFRLASYDLEIRGGGNILGLSQSGHMNQVGIELYYELIDRAVKEIKGEKAQPDIDPEIKVRIPAYIPEEYVPDIHQRLQIYKRLGGGLEEGMIADVRDELRDRFGPVPHEVENLLLVSGIKRVLKEHMIRSLEFSAKNIVLAFHPEAEESLEKVLGLLQKNGGSLRFTPDHRLYIPFAEKQQWGAMVQKVRETLA